MICLTFYLLLFIFFSTLNLLFNFWNSLIHHLFEMMIEQYSYLYLTTRLLKQYKEKKLVYVYIDSKSIANRMKMKMKKEMKE